MFDIKNAVSFYVVLACFVSPIVIADDRPSYLPAGNLAFGGRDTFCTAYSAWHVLHYLGKDVSLDVICDELELGSNNAAGAGKSIEELSRLLLNHGVKNSPMVLQRERLPDISSPLIICYPSDYEEDIGHCAFLVPIRGGGRVVLSGDKVVYLSDDDIVSSSWLGHAIVIGVANRDYVRFVVSAFVVATSSLLFLAVLVVSRRECSSTARIHR